MMGERQVMQEALFYGFSLERHVPDNHLLRKIDRFVDLTGLRTYLEPYYSETGRPSIDRGLLLRHSLRASAVRRGPPQSGLPLVSLGGHGLSTPLSWLARWEALGRVQASLRAQRSAALADRMG